MSSLHPSLLCCATLVLLCTFGVLSPSSRCGVGVGVAAGYMMALYVSFAVVPGTWYVWWMTFVWWAAAIRSWICVGRWYGWWTGAWWVCSIIELSSQWHPGPWWGVFSGGPGASVCMVMAAWLTARTPDRRQAVLHTGTLLALAMQGAFPSSAFDAAVHGTVQKMVNEWWEAAVGLELLEQATRGRKGFDGQTLRAT
jgi:hypothetical protein